MGSGASLRCADSHRGAEIAFPLHVPIKTWSLPPTAEQSISAPKTALTGIYGTCWELPNMGPQLNVMQLSSLGGLLASAKRDQAARRAHEPKRR